MQTINFVFAVHNHQPIGNFDSVFEEAFNTSYKPFLDVLERHPSVKITQHWTGPLLEWIGANHPEFIDRIRGMVQRGQIELLTGAYYEAILPVIPPDDRVGQIRKLTALLKDLFGVEPRGMWLAERVWEQHLVSSLAEAGIEFVMIDDTHFRYAGLRDDQLYGYYITEDNGNTLAVLPINRTLRYALPFKPLSSTFEYFRTVSSLGGRRVVVHGDDGEKFGVWPKTYHSVYEEGWLESFCRMVEQESAWVKPIHAGTIIDLFSPVGRVYLPSAAYGEMLKWALTPRAYAALEHFEQELKDHGLYEENAMFVRGGYWRNFLAKYPESNHMHKKMLRIASRIHALHRSQVPAEVRDAVWAGQCNDPYWHGVFGGLYLPNLRMPVYRNLLRAEAGLDILQPARLPVVEETDFDADGHAEVVVESSRLDMCFTPASGATMIELSAKPEAVNLLDIVSRREEGYHRQVGETARGGRNASPGGIEAEEPGLRAYLSYDWYRHGSFIDHFFGDGAALQDVQRCSYPEVGDFVNQPYAVSRRVSGKEIEVTFEREGAIWRSATPHRLSVKKTLRYVDGRDAFFVDYMITNREQRAIDLWFGVECCIGEMAGDAPDRFYDIEGRSLPDRRLMSQGEETNVKSFKLVDRWLRLQTAFTLDRPATLWRFPLETVSLSVAKFERVFQASVVIPHWRFRLASAAEAHTGAHLMKMRICQAVSAA